MRISDAGARLVVLSVVGLLTACGDAAMPADDTAQTRAPRGDALILCAQGEQALARRCTIDRDQGKDGLILTVRHPDGAFHRLLVMPDGRGVMAADGAVPARVSIVGNDEIQVALGGDLYRLPAMIKSPPTP